MIAILAITGLGVLTATVGTVIAQAAAPDVAPWVSGGGAVAAVGGLAYIAKKLAAGELVALPVADLLKNANAREDKYVELVREGDERQERLEDIVDDYRAFLMAGRASDG